jgi:hypothetical protein
MVIVFGVEVVFDRFRHSSEGNSCGKLFRRTARRSQSFERIRRIVTTFSRGAARCFLAVTDEFDSSGEIPLLIRWHLFIDFAGVRAVMTARGNGAIIQERDQGELSALLDYRKDVISNR